MAKFMSKGFMFPWSSFDCGEIYHHRRHGISSFPNKSVNLSCLPSSCLPRSNFCGPRLIINEGVPMFNRRNPQVAAQMSIEIKKAQNWWEKGLQPNMKEVTSAQDLVDSLLSAGDKLVVVDFFSSGCRGCKALHPKIKKFKDALAKYGMDRCTIGSPKGLEEKELLALAANKDLSFNYTPNTEEEPILVTSPEEVEDRTPPNIDFPLPCPIHLPLSITSTSS